MVTSLRQGVGGGQHIALDTGLDEIRYEKTSNVDDERLTGTDLTTTSLQNFTKCPHKIKPDFYLPLSDRIHSSRGYFKYTCNMFKFSKMYQVSAGFVLGKHRRRNVQSFSAGIDFRRQNLTSTDVTF